MSDHLGCWEGGVEEGTNLTFACEHGVGREGSYGSLICGLLPGRCTNTNDEGSRLEVRLHLQPLSLIILPASFRHGSRPKTAGF